MIYTQPVKALGIMASVKLCIAMLFVFAPLYRFLQSSDDDKNLHPTRQMSDWKVRATSVLSQAFRRQLAALDKVNQRVRIAEIQYMLTLV